MRDRFDSERILQVFLVAILAQIEAALLEQIPIGFEAVEIHRRQHVLNFHQMITIVVWGVDGRGFENRLDLNSHDVALVPMRFQGSFAAIARVMNHAPVSPRRTNGMTLLILTPECSLRQGERAKWMTGATIDCTLALFASHARPPKKTPRAKREFANRWTDPVLFLVYVELRQLESLEPKEAHLRTTGFF